MHLLKKNNTVLLAYIPDFGTIVVFAENYSIKFSAEQITGVQKKGTTLKFHNLFTAVNLKMK